LKRILLFLICAVSFAAECPVQSSVEGPVHYYGKLKAREGKGIIDGVKNGTVAQIRGLSFFWSQWSKEFYNANAVGRLVADWKAELVRAAYGATGAEFSNETIGHIKTVAEAAIANDIYVIIDWHSHSAHNAAETERAKNFFKEIAKIYGKCDNVIFELYNEPTNATWQQIKTYAEAVIPVIREYSDNLILVGTPNYSQKVQDVVGNAIADANVGYVLHFYAASHPLSLWRDNIDLALSRGLPIFVTEYGTTTSDGGCSPKETANCKVDNYDSHNATNANQWHAYMDRNKISSAAWSVFDKYEGSAFFGTVPSGTFNQSVAANWADATKMTASGQYIFKKLNEYYKTAPWNPNAVPIKPPAIANLPQTGDVSIEIFSLQGKKMGNSLNNLSSGTYILLLKQGSQTKSIKFVKK